MAQSNPIPGSLVSSGIDADSDDVDSSPSEIGLITENDLARRRACLPDEVLVNGLFEELELISSSPSPAPTLKMQPRLLTACVLDDLPEVERSLMFSPETSPETILSWATAKLTRHDNDLLNSHLHHGIMIFQQWSTMLGSWDGRCHHGALVWAGHVLNQVHLKIRQIQLMDEEGWKVNTAAPRSILAKFQKASITLDRSVLDCSIKIILASHADTDAINIHPEQIYEFCAKVEPLGYLIAEANRGLSICMDISVDIMGEDPVVRLFPSGRNLHNIDEVEEIGDY
ncbi:hypothetical protein NCS56_01511200 [Fusarium sp. Ph1]|nr:hypothetical protein NCS56_01511200 [Fusarium sp. Ph1]